MRRRQARPPHLTFVLAINAIIGVILFVTPIWAQTQTDVVSAVEQQATLVVAGVSALCMISLTLLARQGIPTFMWTVRIATSVLCCIYALIFLITPPAGVNFIELAFAAPLIGWVLFLNWFLHRALVRALYEQPAGQSEAKL